MRTPAAPTYLLPGDDTVEAGQWKDRDGIKLGETIEHWDPLTELLISRAVTVDLDAVRSQCRLGPDSAFAVLASWRCPHRTRLGGAGERIDLGDLGGLVRAPVAMEVPGPESGGRLDLTTRLLLLTPGSDPSPISPRRVGAVLWTDSQRVALEGSAARFPMTAIDFAAVPRVPDGAAWYVDWDHEDLHAPVLGGLRLLLNTAHPRITSAVRTASDDPAAKIVRSLIECDVAGQLVRAALDSEQFVETPEAFADDSVGQMLADLLEMVWPGIPVTGLRQRARLQPSRLEAELQEALSVAA
jgi:hypothetical protein